MEGEDVDYDGAKDEQSEEAGFRDCDEDAADDFKDFDEGEVSGWVKGGHEKGGW